MTGPTALALLGFLGWTLALLLLMELLRARLVLIGATRADRFTPDNAGLSPFMQRLARAHANCIEGLPLFGGLMLLALVSGQSALTDPLAPWLLGARLLQSSVHLASLQVMAINLRFAAFMVQVGIAVWWCWLLLRA
jgi:uncharacterized MAPEG superfamily protein